MYVPLRLGFFITARHCASLFFFHNAFPRVLLPSYPYVLRTYVCTYIDDEVRSRAALLALVD